MSGNLTSDRGGPNEAGASPTPPDPDHSFTNRSGLDRALTWYRGELALRLLVGVLALPALAGLTGIGMLFDPGPVPWLMAGLTFLAASEVVLASMRLRRRR
jgi:hypothetical protein